MVNWLTTLSLHVTHSHSITQYVRHRWLPEATERGVALALSSAAGFARRIVDSTWNSAPPQAAAVGVADLRLPAAHVTPQQLLKVAAATTAKKEAAAGEEGEEEEEEAYVYWAELASDSETEVVVRRRRASTMTRRLRSRFLGVKIKRQAGKLVYFAINGPRSSRNPDMGPFDDEMAAARAYRDVARARRTAAGLPAKPTSLLEPSVDGVKARVRFSKAQSRYRVQGYDPQLHKQV